MNKNIEKIFITIIYLTLFLNAYFMHDSIVALISAFCGITYTILAGKGNPVCYLIGLIGSAFYIYLAYINQLWGNFFLYALYFVPMQIIGFFNWNKFLKKEKYEIEKCYLNKKELILSFLLTLIISVFAIFILYKTGDKSPIIDGLTTTFSLLGMYYTVKRAVEQWFIWTGVNFLTLIMWLLILYSGEKVYSTAYMWLVYFILGLYFYILWKKELDFTA